MSGRQNEAPVKPRSFLAQHVAELTDERDRYRRAIEQALASDLALTEHDPEWRACRDAVMADLRRALDG